MTARSKDRIRSAAQAEALAEHLQQGAAIKVAETEHECSLLCGFPLQGCYNCNRFVTILQMQCLEEAGELSGVLTRSKKTVPGAWIVV